jgi:hypothetical protein
MTPNDRDDELRYSMKQLELWLVRWRDGQAPVGRQLWLLKSAVAELHIDEGEAYEPSEPSTHSDVANMLVAIDPEQPLLPEGEAMPETSYTLAEFVRDMEMLRSKFDYLSWHGGRPMGRA